jgi:gas vesicle protein
MGIFTKVVGYTAHKTTKVAKGSGGFVKNFVSEVKADMKTFEEVDNLKSRMKDLQRNMIIDGDIIE